MFKEITSKALFLKLHQCIIYEHPCTKANSGLTQVSMEYLCPQLCVVLKTTLSIQSPKSWWYIGWRHLLTFNLDWDLNHFKQLNKSQRQQELSKEDKLNKHIFPIFIEIVNNVAIIDPSRREDMTLYANNVHQILHDSVLSTRIISSDLVSVSQCL